MSCTPGGGLNTFSIEISTGCEINQDLHDGVGISLGTPGGGLKGNSTHADSMTGAPQITKRCSHGPAWEGLYRKVSTQIEEGQLTL